MEADFQWRDDYSIGIEEIDVQHKRFLRFIKAVYDLDRKKGDEKEIMRLLDELIRYTTFHLDSEELFMKLYFYPKLGHQLEEHGKIRAQLQEKAKNIKEHGEELSGLLIFLMKWFVNHTTYVDKELGDYMRKYDSMIYGT